MGHWSNGPPRPSRAIPGAAPTLDLRPGPTLDGKGKSQGKRGKGKGKGKGNKGGKDDTGKKGSGSPGDKGAA